MGQLFLWVPASGPLPKMATFIDNRSAESARYLLLQWNEGEHEPVSTFNAIWSLLVFFLPLTLSPAPESNSSIIILGKLDQRQGLSK